MAQLIFDQEVRQYDHVMEVFFVATRLVGPTIQTHGTERQRQRFLPPILRGEEIWCQLFSEPGAGSDLAGLQTRAVPDGDEWIVNGQKVWTSGAQYSDWGILLARSDSRQPKHRGITCFLVRMQTPGIDVRPIKQINGETHFNEVFLSDVSVPAKFVLGEVNEGWRVALTTLGFERSAMAAASVLPRCSVESLTWMAVKSGRSRDPLIRQDVAAAYIRARILEFLGYRVQTAISRGEAIGAEGSVMKMMLGQHFRHATNLGLTLLGSDSMADGGLAAGRGQWLHGWMTAPSLRIAGGTEEVQRNIIGERLLDLPPEPRFDKAIPFSDIRPGTRCSP